MTVWLTILASGAVTYLTRVLPLVVTTGGAEVGAAVVALALAAWRRNLLLAVIAGVAVVAVLRAASL